MSRIDVSQYLLRKFAVKIKISLFQGWINSKEQQGHKFNLRINTVLLWIKKKTRTRKTLMNSEIGEKSKNAQH